MAHQRGQSMVEYLIVTSALVGAMFWAANADCPGYDNCISKLLTVLHDNYSGYSASISAVQKYGDFAANDNGSSWGDGDDEDGSGGGSGSGGGLNQDGLTQVTHVTSSNGFDTYGKLQADGTVTDNSGNVVGTYDEATGIFTPNDGATVSAITQKQVLDEGGNVLQLQAVIDCNKPPTRIHAFAYQSTVTDKVYSNVTFSEMDADGYCMEAAYKIIDTDGNEAAGRIVDGWYYAAVESTEVGSEVKNPDGEVIYWSDLNRCSVMVKDWDEDVDTSLDPAFQYLERLKLYNDARIGEMSSSHYVEQTMIYGETSWPNDCVSNRSVP